MKQLKLKQGSPEWHAHRRNFRNASDAPAMMGCSIYKTRDQLLHEVATGLAEEVNERQQQRFDAGHRAEALARPLAEEIIGERLYPVVGVEGTLSASFDGLTMNQKVNYEHKSLNDELRGCMNPSATGADLPLMYRVQMEQQHMVSGAEKTFFMASKWAGEDLVEERHVWYIPNQELAAQIAAGWAQFEIDLAAYQPPAASKPAAVGAPVLDLLSVNIKVEGSIALIDNLGEFGDKLNDYIAGINLKPETDQDFANLDSAVKTLKRAEEALEAGKAHALSQTASIELMVRTVDNLKKVCSTNRLIASKLFDSEKLARKTLLVLNGKEAAAKHINDLNTAIGKPYMPLIQYDFAAVISGMKSVDNMKAAINTELARVKIEANTIADKIRTNIATLQERASEHKFLFSADIATLVLKTPEDLDSTITARISEHDRAEHDRREKEREKIRQEEAAKLVRTQAIDARIGAFTTIGEPLESREIVELHSILEMIRGTVISAEHFDDRVQEGLGAKATAEKRVQAAIDAATAKLPPAVDAEVSTAQTPVSATIDEGAARQVKEVVSHAQASVPAAASAPVSIKPAGPPDLKLGEICTRLGFTITAAFLAELGYPPAAKAGSANLYHQADYPRICKSLIEHIQKASQLQAA